MGFINPNFAYTSNNRIGIRNITWNMPSLSLQTAELESLAVPLAKTLLLFAQQSLQALKSSNLALDAHSRLGFLSID